MAQEIRPLSRSQRQTIQTTVVSWAAVHPDPDRPIILLADGSEVSPRDIAQAVVHPESPLGRYFYRVFAVGLITDEIDGPQTLDQILSAFRKDTEIWTHGRWTRLVMKQEEPEKEPPPHEEEHGLE
jgi:hypothetical protein